MSLPPPPDPSNPYGQQPPPYGEPQYPPPGYGYPPPGYPPPPGYAYGYPRPQPSRRSEPKIGWLLLGAGLIGVIGSLSPWAYVDLSRLGGSDITLWGGDRDGAISAFCAGVVAIMGLLIAVRQGQLWTSIVGVVFGSFTVLIALIDLGDINNLYDERSALADDVISTGFGLWLVLVGGVLALALSIVAMVRRPVSAPVGPART